MHMAAPVSVAVVGVAVELPGASDMDALWNILKNGLNTVSEVCVYLLPLAGAHLLEIDTRGAFRRIDIQ